MTQTECVPYAEIQKPTTLQEEIQKLTTLQWGILKCLDEKESYGMEMIEKISNLTDCEVWKGPGTFYPSLKRLREKEYIISIKEHTGGKQRKMHKITHKGRMALSCFYKYMGVDSPMPP
jgi:DNA-binding PadR family transcriptional regulator